MPFELVESEELVQTQGGHAKNDICDAVQAVLTLVFGPGAGGAYGEACWYWAEDID